MTCAYPGCARRAQKAGVLYCGDHIIWPQDSPTAAEAKRAPERKPDPPL
ncbi:MAG: hypothetical protein ABIJ96_06650 [Elusimicrobiota bacterium]